LIGSQVCSGGAGGRAVAVDEVIISITFETVLVSGAANAFLLAGDTLTYLIALDVSARRADRHALLLEIAIYHLPAVPEEEVSASAPSARTLIAHPAVGGVEREALLADIALPLAEIGEAVSS
jgi:hypothetical protein